MEEKRLQKITVRKADGSDAAALAEILVKSFRAAFGEIISQETIERCSNEENCRNMFAAICASGRGQFYLAELEGKPCGEIYWCDSEELENAAEIVAVHSLPETWGTGVGKAMLGAALDGIKAAGKESVYLWAFKDNKRARRFYEKNGFAADGAERVSQFDGAVEVRYVCTLER